jgi:hypothetical protein
MPSQKWGGKRMGAGRPPLNLTEKITVEVSARMKQAVLDAAEERGIPAARLIRELLRKELGLGEQDEMSLAEAFLLRTQRTVYQTLIEWENDIAIVGVYEPKKFADFQYILLILTKHTQESHLEFRPTHIKDMDFLLLEEARFYAKTMQAKETYRNSEHAAVQRLSPKIESL